MEYGPFLIDPVNFESELKDLIEETEWTPVHYRDISNEIYFIKSKSDNRVIAQVTTRLLDGKLKIRFAKLVSTGIILKGLPDKEQQLDLDFPKDFCGIFARYLIIDRKAEYLDGKRIIDSGNDYSLLLVKITRDNGVAEDFYLDDATEETTYQSSPDQEKITVVPRKPLHKPPPTKIEKPAAGRRKYTAENLPDHYQKVFELVKRDGKAVYSVITSEVKHGGTLISRRHAGDIVKRLKDEKLIDWNLGETE